MYILLNKLSLNLKTYCKRKKVVSKTYNLKTLPLLRATCKQ